MGINAMTMEKKSFYESPTSEVFWCIVEDPILYLKGEQLEQLEDDGEFILE